MATYTNIVLNETYTLSGVQSLESAWNLSEFVCKRNNWNYSTFCSDVIVKFN